VNDGALASIDHERRAAISRAHTATHMVHKAFREALGETATQAGSENAPGRFRFDFPASGAVPPSVLRDVESRVNSLLIENLSVTAEEMSQADAKSIGAMALFGEKYGDKVRVVSVGDWARELCGGTHVMSSAELGLVKLLSESSIGAGVRRVEALVGFDAFNFLAREHILLNQITDLIKGSRVEELPERISEILEKMKVIEKELSNLRAEKALAAAADLLKKSVHIGSTSALFAQGPEGLSADILRAIALELRSKKSNSVVALTSLVDGKVVLVVAADEEARKAGVKAGGLVKTGSTILGGGGGGKDDFAQGGGVDASKIDFAFAEMKKALQGTLGA
jgi:alanyl-tRNA synthetase